MKKFNRAGFAFSAFSRYWGIQAEKQEAKAGSERTTNFWLSIILSAVSSFGLRRKLRVHSQFGAVCANARRAALCVLLCAALPVCSEESRQYFAIDTQSVETAVKTLSKQTNYQFIYTDPSIAMARTAGFSGTMTVKEALAAMLAGTDIRFQYITENTVRLYRQLITKKNAKPPPPQKTTINVNTKIEEVHVVGAADARNLARQPAGAITIGSMDASDLKERAINNFEDLGLAVPGLSVQDTGGLHRRVFIRGVGNWSSSASLIGIYLDEASVTANPAFQLDLRPYDLERIEVMRGAQSTTWGEGSVAGVIRFITQKPGLERLEGRVELTAALTQGGAPGQKLQGMINLPVVTDTFGIRIAGTLDQSGGWIDQPAAQRRDINDQNARNIYIKSLWRPNNKWSINGTTLIHRNNIASNIGEDVNGNFTQVFGLLTEPTVQDEYDLHSVALNYDASAFSLTSSTSYLQGFKRSKNLGNWDTLLPPPAPVLERMFLDYPINTRVFNQEIRLTSREDDNWRWLAGGFYRDARVDQTSRFFYQEPDKSEPSSYVFDNLKTSKSAALFGNVAYALNERLELGAGLRVFEDHRKYFDSYTLQSGVFNSVNPRLYINFDMTPVTRIYGNVVKGFRSGGFNLLGAPPYAPDSLWTAELGGSTSLRDGKLTAEMAVFYSIYEDYQAVSKLSLPVPPLQILVNTGDGKIRGLDWSFVWRVTENLDFRFGGNYVDSRFFRINASPATHAPGDRLDLVPEYGLTLSSTWHFSLRDRPGFARLDYDQQGRAVLRDRLRGEHYRDTSDVINMLNFYAEWQWSQRITMGVFCKNLLNERGHIDPFSFIGRASRPRPRNIGVKLKVEF